MASKVLHFYAFGLKKDTTVMLTFEPPKGSKLYVDQFPVAWKVITFRAKGHAHATVNYESRLAFGYAEMDQGNLVDPMAWVEVKSGDVTSLVGTNGDREFGAVARASKTRAIACKNSTDGRVDITLGFVKGDGIAQRFEPILLWDGVGSKSSVVTQFTPILKAYVTRDYQTSEMIRGEVQTDEIWSQNLNALDDVTTFNFVEDSETGVFSVNTVDTI